ncbi:MAG TPA: glycosyltransferase family 4 protein [Mucilaginibacter sp.]|jgi:glycosyltransferase involved in cell wall biosynthesis
MKKNKVLQLVTGLNPGGAEKVVLDLSSYLNNHQFDVYVIGLSKYDKLLEVFLDKGIKTKILGISKGPVSFFKGIYFVNNFIRDNGIRLVHAHMTHSLIFASVLKFFNPGLLIVFTSHNFNLGSKIRFGLVRMLKPFRNADILFSKRMQRSCYRSDALIIPNGIDTNEYNCTVPKNKKFTFITIGRIEHVKNHKQIIDFARELKNKFEFEIYIVGEGQLKLELIAYVKEREVGEIVKFLGFRRDIGKLCSQSHVFILPSLWEGLPISVLEAGACRLPVISTPVGSIPEILSEDFGYLSDLPSFAQTMFYVYEHYQEASVKGNALGNLIREKYDLKIVANKHIELYNQLSNNN